MSAGKEAEVIGKDVPLPVARAAQVDQLMAALAAIPLVESSEDGLDVALRVMNATNWEDVNLGDSGLPQSKDLVGKSIRVERLERHESDKDGALPWYLVVDGTLDNGRPIRFSTGAAVIMAQLAKLHALGKLPAIVTITATQTRSGQQALQLRVDAVN